MTPEGTHTMTTVAAAKPAKGVEVQRACALALVALTDPDAPDLRGLPRICIWTVNEYDGLKAQLGALYDHQVLADLERWRAHLDGTAIQHEIVEHSPDRTHVWFDAVYQDAPVKVWSSIATPVIEIPEENA